MVFCFGVLFHITCASFLYPRGKLRRWKHAKTFQTNRETSSELAQQRNDNEQTSVGRHVPDGIRQLDQPNLTTSSYLLHLCKTDILSRLKGRDLPENTAHVSLH